MAPPRAIWTGSISFGLVNAPVRMYTAISEKDLRFNMLHQPDGGRIGYLKVCKVDDKPVPADEIVRAYDVGGGEFVELTEDDFAAASTDGTHAMTIHDFVPLDQIDPIFFERTYFLGPQEGPGEAIYSLLSEAMDQAGLAAIATYVHHDREHLGCLRVRDGVLTLERMFFADEIRATEGLAPAAGKVDARQLKMASDLIDAYTSDFDPTKYHDTYRQRLLEIIDQKRQGKTVKPPTAEKGEAPPDLMAALAASLDEARKARDATEKPAAKPKRPKAAAAAGGGRAPARKGRRGA